MLCLNSVKEATRRKDQESDIHRVATEARPVGATQCKTCSECDQQSDKGNHSTALAGREEGRHWQGQLRGWRKECAVS